MINFIHILKGSFSHGSEGRYDVEEGALIYLHETKEDAIVAATLNDEPLLEEKDLESQ